MKPNTMEQFWAKVDKNGPLFEGTRCWIWKACIVGGYGAFKWHGKNIGAHRLAWTDARGDIPEGKELHHRCPRTACVNPDHMMPLKKWDHGRLHDSMTAVNSRKTHCKAGHLFDEDNTYIRPDGGRFCRACHNVRNQVYYDKTYPKKPARTECHLGHPLSGDNLYLRPNGTRECRTCMRMRDKKRRGRR